uniref:Zinc finger family protein n=1 Tax=Tetraselmis sp. GSL018 TaxID=582737 RepID=A0A061S7G1_9CHLO
MYESTILAEVESFLSHLIDEVVRTTPDLDSSGVAELTEAVKDVSLEEDELVCAICLESVAQENSAILKDCQHLYCVNCILRWSQVREDSTSCPKCKTPFTCLYTYRRLDGTLSDFPQEETVYLLRRASWFVDSLKSIKGKGQVVHDQDHDEDDWCDDWFDDDDEDFDDHLFLEGSGRRQRVLLGNRRWGSNGYIQSGRMAARPIARAPRQSKAEAKASRKEKDFSCEVVGGRRGGSSGGSLGKHAAGPMGSSPPALGAMGAAAKASPAGGGRRARRAAKRAQQDVHP